MRVSMLMSGLALLGTVTAAPGAAETHTFDGACGWIAVAELERPVPFLVPEVLHGTQTGAGLCSGMLDGRFVGNSPVSITGTGTVTGICFGAVVSGSVSVRFTFDTASTDDDVVLGLRYESIGLNAATLWLGQESGFGPGPILFNGGDSSDPMACGGTRLHFTVSIRSVQPFVG